MADPSIDRPIMPEGYGVPASTGGTLVWENVERELLEAEHYWLATSRPDGRPHVVPRWGVWCRDRFWYDGSPETLHARNLRANDAVALHLESGKRVVIIDGVSAPSDPVTGELGRVLSNLFVIKYAESGYAPEPDAWSGPDAGGMAVFTPRSALAWFDFPNDVTRFRFGTD